MGNCSSNQTPSSLPSETDFIDQILTACSSEIVLDESRRTFVADQALTVHQLLSGNLKFLNRFRRTLLGRKGVGKSSLLSNLASALHSICGNKLLIFSITLAEASPTPRELLCRALNLSKHSNWDVIENKLQSSGLRVTLIVDEFNLVYNKGLRPNGVTFVEDIMRIGTDNKGYYHCILTGSCSFLRKLITGKLTRTEAHENFLDNYLGVDLNGTKFQPITIFPFTNQSDLENLVSYVVNNVVKKKCVIDLEELAIETAGFPGLIGDYLRNGKLTPLDNYSVGLRNLSSATNPASFAFLQILLICVKELKSARSILGDNQSEEFSWVDKVSVDTVFKDFQKPVPPNLLYELADMGYIQYTSEKGYGRIGFYSPKIYLEMLAQCEGGLTLTELMALRHPHNVYEKEAERVTSNILMTAEDLWKNIFEVEDFKPVDFKDAPSELSSLFLSDGSPGEGTDIKYNTLLKECFGVEKQRDTLGADFVYIEEKSRRIHRIQLKLGRSQLKLENFNQITQIFSSKKGIAKTAYEKLGLRLEDSSNYLITTRDYNPADSVAAVNSGLKIIDNKILRDCKVWPRQVQDLGRPFSK